MFCRTCLREERRKEQQRTALTSGFCHDRARRRSVNTNARSSLLGPCVHGVPVRIKGVLRVVHNALKFLTIHESDMPFYTLNRTDRFEFRNGPCSDFFRSPGFCRDLGLGHSPKWFQ